MRTALVANMFHGLLQSLGELATAIPMYGPRACASLISANPWARRFVPGMDWSLARAQRARPLPLPRPDERGARVDGASLLPRGGHVRQRAEPAPPGDAPG